MKEYRINYSSSFYYLEKKVKILWIFYYWTQVSSSHDLDGIKEEIEKIKNGKSD